MLKHKVSPGHDNSGEVPQKANEGEDDNLILGNLDKEGEGEEYGEEDQEELLRLQEEEMLEEFLE